MPSIDFCQMIAETITSDSNQHATMMITATTGAGKSEAGLAIAERVSQIVAEIKGGAPENYFTVDNVAIVTNSALRAKHFHQQVDYHAQHNSNKPHLDTV